ncbi:hypothetical protein T459_30063 [Capsicum annuum]|uniref:Uncharacterized protein n=1 Tax=Capsicum annuum TaxID=4072 RepID=A0A2G2Y7B9_CAPAN|nr:hypothetical protein T459_30063 [Capsicum annuum]
MASIFLFVFFLFLLRKWKSSNSQTKRLPPGPWKHPFIGSMHYMVGGCSHRLLKDIAKKYRPLRYWDMINCVINYADFSP